METVTTNKGNVSIMQSEGINSTSNSYDTDIIPQDFIEGGTEGRIANSLFQLNEAPS